MANGNADNSNHLTAYIAGITDAHFNFVSKISKDSARKVGYKFQFELKYNTEIKEVSDLIQKFLSDMGLEPRVRYRNKKKYDAYQIIIGRVDDIDVYLSELLPYMSARKAAAELLINSIFPKIRDKQHSTKEGFVEIAGLVDEFRKEAGRDNRSKYNQNYFIENWNVQL